MSGSAAIDPDETFELADANVDYWIAKQSSDDIDHLGS